MQGTQLLVSTDDKLFFVKERERIDSRTGLYSFTLFHVNGKTGRVEVESEL